MDLKRIFFISLMLFLTLHAVSASDVNETFGVDDIIFEDYDSIVESDISQAEISQDYACGDEINMSENEILYEDILISNESYDNNLLIIYEENINNECGENISYTHFSNESIDNKEDIGSIIFVEIPTTFNLNVVQDIELEIHIFITSFEFKFFESRSLNLLILDVNLYFDKVISKGLTKDIVICSKKIKWDYIYSIDNSIAADSFNSFNRLSFFNSYKNDHFLYIINKQTLFIKTN